jgi:hypothetical protein
MPATEPRAAERWSRERIAAWYDAQPWMLGFNYLPRTAVNWTELWQAETFDLATIEEELDWAQRIGLNALRTNLQYLVWKHDAAGLRDRLDRFLGAAARRGIHSMLCLFDDCAFSGREPYLGPQDPPVPNLHNSGGAASPGRAVVRDRAQWPSLERYVKDVVASFRDDARIAAFDLYNEPGNESVFTRKVEPHPDGPLAPHSVELAERAFGWSREAGATQPLTTGVWNRGMDPALDRRLLDASDFVSFHDYLPLEKVAEQVAALRAEGRPIVCTEWLARGLRSRPETHLPFFAKERIGCFHWGLVNGRTQTHRPWPGLERWIPDDGVWHHDLLHADGTPYDEREIALFRAHAPTP